MSKSLETIERWDLFLLTLELVTGLWVLAHIRQRTPAPIQGVVTLQGMHMCLGQCDDGEAPDAGGEAWPSLWSLVTQPPVLWEGTIVA